MDNSNNQNSSNNSNPYISTAPAPNPDEAINPMPSWPPLPPTPPIEPSSIWRPVSQNNPPVQSQPESATWNPLPSTPSQPPMPTFTTLPQEPTSELAGITTPMPDQTLSSPSAPTDLSHLISGNNPVPEAASSQSIPETLIVPQANNSNPDIPTLPTDGHKGIPKWIIGVAIGLILVVAGASAYFILGIGQAPKTASIPVTTTNTLTQTKTPQPIPTPITQPAVQPVASGSANFGQLQGNNNSAPAATSAADLIRQRNLGH